MSRPKTSRRFEIKKRGGWAGLVCPPGKAPYAARIAEGFVDVDDAELAAYLDAQPWAVGCPSAPALVAPAVTPAKEKMEKEKPPG